MDFATAPDGSRWLVSPDWQPRLDPAWLADLAAGRVARRVVRQKARRLVAVAAGPGGKDFFLKAERRDPLSGWLRRALGLSRAAREWRRGRELAAAGLPVPAVVALGVSGGADCLVSLALENVVTLRECLERGRAARGPLLARLAAVVRELHEAGFVHGDLHAENVLARPGAPGAAPEIFLVDLHDVAPGAGPAARAANLALLAYSIRALTGRGERLRFLRAYAGDGDRARALGREVAAALRRLSAARGPNAARRALKSSRLFVAEENENGRVLRRRDFPPARLAAALETYRARRDEPGFCLKADKARRVALAGEVCVKEFGPPDFIGRLKNLFRPDPPRRSWLGGNRLRDLGLAAARPLALVRAPDGRAFLLTAALAGAGERALDRYVAGEFAPGPRRRRRAFARALGRFLARLHEAGVYHPDLKGSNIFVAARAGGWEFPLLDADRIAVSAAVSSRHVGKNLGQVLAALRRLLPATDLCRALKAYAGRRAGRNERRALARAALAAAAGRSSPAPDHFRK